MPNEHQSPENTSLVESDGVNTQPVVVTQWTATDPSGAKHHLELAGEVVRCRGGDVHPWILQAVQAGRVGRIYGWWVKSE